MITTVGRSGSLAIGASSIDVAAADVGDQEAPPAGELVALAGQDLRLPPVGCALIGVEPLIAVLVLLAGQHSVRRPGEHGRQRHDLQRAERQDRVDHGVQAEDGKGHTVRSATPPLIWLVRSGDLADSSATSTITPDARQPAATGVGG